MKINRFLCLLWIGFFSFSSLRADQCPTLFNETDETRALGEMRVRALRGWDRLLTWTLSPQIRPYAYKIPLEQKSFQVTTKELFEFAKNYGYFSIHHPIVGIVTDSKRDIEVTKCLLFAIQNDENEQLRFSREEILAKVLAYRPLKKGMKISIPIDGSLETYLVDEVMDLWHGMPAFGLIPEKKEGAVPILLFRGTDLSITTEKSWASILSDLDTNGPGYMTFLRGQKIIHSWLEKMRKKHFPARLIGFSLGGSFVLYTLIFEYDLVNQEYPSIAFNPPGVSKEMLQKWEAVPEQMKAPHIIYVNQGDFVSQIGFLLPNIWELSLDHPMGIIEAHVSLISTKPSFKMTAVDAKQENANRDQ